MPTIKSGITVGESKRSKDIKIMAIVDASVFPAAAHIENAAPQAMLLEKTIDSSFTEHAPEKLMGAKCNDSESLDQKLLQECEIEG